MCYDAGALSLYSTWVLQAVPVQNLHTIHSIIGNWLQVFTACLLGVFQASQLCLPQSGHLPRLAVSTSCPCSQCPRCCGRLHTIAG